MAAKKSVFGELCKSAFAGAAAVAIVGSILGLLLRFGSLPSGAERKSPAARKKAAERPKLAESNPGAEKEEPSDVGDQAKAVEKKVEPASPVAEAAKKTAEIADQKPRPAAEVLAELKRIPAKKSIDDSRRRAELIGELFRSNPTHRQLPSLLIERWLTLRDDPEVTAEREEAMTRKAGDPIGNAAAYVAAAVAIEDPSVDRPSAQKAIGAFSARSKGKSPLIAELLGKLAEEKTESTQDQQAIYLSIVQGFPGTPAAQVAGERLAKLDMEKFESAVDPDEAANDPRIGRPFEFAFQDAVSGEFITSAGLRGRVLVIDFWATWCPPCVAAMPKMKELYQKYAPQGVVFIGVSHDDPGQVGLQKLLSFVAANEIPWPQYHQANRELSRAWNVSGIPSVFVVDQEGRVVTTQGSLDQVIQRLLGDMKAKKPKAAARGEAAKKAAARK